MTPADHEPEVQLGPLPRLPRAVARRALAWLARLGGVRLAALLLAALPLLALALVSFAAGGEPEYPHGDYQGDCTMCHGENGWKPARIGRTFDHAKATRSHFALKGAHATASCTACHATLDFSKQKTMCVSCHQDPHLGELGTDCARCHTPRSFIDRAGMVRMHQSTRFPLTGAHAGIDCESCHPPVGQGRLRFVATSAECSGCHMPDYRAAKVPDHVASGFTLECAACHNTMAFQPARFDHAGTGFPLTGAHRRTPCLSCHGDGVWRGKSTDCYSCHQPDYQATTNPAHAGAGFPTACATCHTTTAWQPATFDHDGPYFPIYSGTHAGRWSACSDCHTNPSNYAAFDCLGCHGPDTSNQHTGVSGYTYTSQGCYTCHPRGRAGN